MPSKMSICCTSSSTYILVDGPIALRGEAPEQVLEPYELVRER